MNDWTNALKAGVILVVQTAMTFILALAIFLGVDVDVKAFAGLSLAFEAFVGSILGLWIILTYRNSPLRVADDVDVMTAAMATHGTALKLPSAQDRPPAA